MGAEKTSKVSRDLFLILATALSKSVGSREEQGFGKLWILLQCPAELSMKCGGGGANFRPQVQLRYCLCQVKH